MPDGTEPATASGLSLRADCARCSALCCVAPAFSASADFAISKPAGQPCPNLSDDFRCSIHRHLRQQGFPGCSAYDCFGAGQHVVQGTFGGQDWRAVPELAEQMFAVFAVMRQLHELLWHLGEALTLEAARPLRAELDAAATEIERLTGGGPAEILALDLASHWQQVSPLLQRASELARAAELARATDLRRTDLRRTDLRRTDLHPADVRPADVRSADVRRTDLRSTDLRPADLRGADLHGADLRGADLVGRKLGGADLRAASLRGARLIGADLRRADLRVADLAGADLRAADLSGADLDGCIFLTQAQLDAARGDQATGLSGSLARPLHWLVAPGTG